MLLVYALREAAQALNSAADRLAETIGGLIAWWDRA